ncbi:MAG TPA: putative metal-binding motif-containing protein [Candidatus Methylomirabilis sp.]|nr:putative metal-binding motif-containing protein [Candidatus Methylomirabilis sp.]
MYKNLKWTLLVIACIALAACGGRVVTDSTGVPDFGSAGAAGVEPDGGSFAGSHADGGGTGGNGGSSGSGGSSGAAGSGQAGIGGEAGSPVVDAGTDGDASDAYPPYCTTKERRLHDLDADGYGDPNNYIFVNVCAPWEDGYVNWITGNDDCDDGNPDVHPGALEVPGNGIDDNCNGVVDEGAVDGGTDGGCQPRLVAKLNQHFDTTVCPGDVAIQTLMFTFTAECQDMEVDRIMLQLVSQDFAATDSTPFCAAPCTSPGDWYFRNLKLTKSTGAGLMGPIDTPSQHTSNDLAHLTFSDSFTLKAGESKLLILQMDVATTFTASLAETRYQAYLLGVDVGDGNIPYVVENNVDPTKAVKVKQACGTLSIVDDNHPASAIVVGGKDSWVPFARYKATVEYESAKIDRVRVGLQSIPGGRAVGADFVEVAVASGGVVRGQDIFPSGAPYERDIDLSSNPIMIPKDGSVAFELWGKMAAPIASSVATPTSPRSGDVFSLTLMHDQTTGEWDANYVGKLNVRTTGDVSGERLYAASGANSGNIMVLRKSKPMFLMVPQSSTQLLNGVEVELAKFQVIADQAGLVGLIQVGFDARLSNGISVNGLRVYRGATMMIPDFEAEVHVQVSDFPDWQGFIPHWIQVELMNEQTIVASGNVFSVRGTLQGVLSGMGAHTTFWRSYAPANETGWLVPGPNGWALYNGADTYMRTLWTDMSELPHDTTSVDWTTDTLVDMIGQTDLYAP